MLPATMRLFPLAMLVACTTLPEPKEPAVLPCACQPPAACPPDVCDLQIEVQASTCQGQVDVVEIELGNHLDPTLFRPGQLQRTCATIPRGTAMTLHARARPPETTGTPIPDWQWVESVTCPVRNPADTTGPTVARILQCSSK